MNSEGIILEYNGPVNHEVIDRLLTRLKRTPDFSKLDTITRKRTYAISVECLENISHHAASMESGDRSVQPLFMVIRQTEKILIRAGNAVTEEMKEKISCQVDHVNNLNPHELKRMHENRICSEHVKGENGAGLGFICMAFKSGNKIGYSFRQLKNDNLYFEIQISLNKYLMRKLIIDKTSHSPGVVLDPEKKIYEIAGESRPPDVREFYDQILTWMDDFSILLLKHDNKSEPLHFSFSFGYFNSASGKLILDICKILARLHARGMNVKVNWCYERDDVDMLEAGQEMSRIVKFPFEYTETDPMQFLS